MKRNPPLVFGLVVACAAVGCRQTTARGTTTNENDYPRDDYPRETVRSNDVRPVETSSAARDASRDAAPTMKSDTPRATTSPVDRDATVPHDVTSRPREEKRESAAPNPETSNAPETLALLVAIDEHEVKAGEAAEKKGVRPSVLEFAKTMEAEHGRHADDTRALAKNLGITLADSTKVTAQRQQGEKDLEKLTSKDASDFESAYVDAMITGHEEVLKKLDQLLADADNDAVRAHLRKTKEAFAHHLEMAKSLRDSQKKQ